MKEPYKVGMRVQLVRMGADDPDPMPPGATGEIISTSCIEDNGRTRHYHLGIKWDAPNDGRTLNVVTPPDVVRVLP
jgi:hypothetical protein